MFGLGRGGAILTGSCSRDPRRVECFRKAPIRSIQTTWQPHSISDTSRPGLNGVPTQAAATRYRFWDGHRWTEWVAVHGQELMDGPVTANDSASLRWLLPVGRSGLAIAAGYAGLFALTVLLAPLALILGLLAARDLRRHPSKLGWGRTIFALATGVLGTVALVAAIIFG